MTTRQQEPRTRPRARAHCIYTSVASLAALLLFGGCSTMTGARPLEPGEHQVGLTLGGPMVEVGGAVLPLPNAVIEGRHGITRLADRELDINYGLNATALAFGIAQVHVGGSYLLLERGDFGLSVTDRLYFATNAIARGPKAESSRGVWGANQTEVTASYLVGQQLLYLSLAEYLDFGNPSLLLTPALGVVFDPGQEGGINLGLEARYYAINRIPEATSVNWWPGERGALGFSFGVSYEFGGCGCDAPVEEVKP